MTESVACRYCRRPIIWARTAANDKPMPLDPDPQPWPTGNVELGDDGAAIVHGLEPLFAGALYVPHFATCPSYEPRSPR